MHQDEHLLKGQHNTLVFIYLTLHTNAAWKTQFHYSKIGLEVLNKILKRRKALARFLPIRSGSWLALLYAFFRWGDYPVTLIALTIAFILSIIISLYRMEIFGATGDQSKYNPKGGKVLILAWTLGLILILEILNLILTKVNVL